MDIYTLCFAYPSAHIPIANGYKPAFHPSTTLASEEAQNAANSTGQEDDGITNFQAYQDSQFQHLYPEDPSNDEVFDVVHAKCLAISSATGCLVSAIQQEPSSESGKNGMARNEGNAEGHGGPADRAGNSSDDGKPRGWEFQLSGGYAQVMDARRRIMADFKPDVSFGQHLLSGFVFRVCRSCFADRVYCSLSCYLPLCRRHPPSSSSVVPAIPHPQSIIHQTRLLLDTSFLRPSFYILSRRRLTGQDLPPRPSNTHPPVHPFPRANINASPPITRHLRNNRISGCQGGCEGAIGGD